MSTPPRVLGEEDFEIKPSSIPGIGLGLFARRTIRKGDTIGPYTGKVITDAQAEREPYVRSHYILWVCRDCNIVAEGSRAAYTRYINHSDRPNARFVISTRWKKARVEAIKRIRTGEEIFLDYGPYFWDAVDVEKRER
jgi:SET domain-containing protein